MKISFIGIIGIGSMQPMVEYFQLVREWERDGWWAGDLGEHWFPHIFPSSNSSQFYTFRNKALVSHTLYFILHCIAFIPSFILPLYFTILRSVLSFVVRNRLWFLNGPFTNKYAHTFSNYIQIKYMWKFKLNTKFSVTHL